ncbi:uncharacterized protein EV420DRAFT_1750054 [Desarmillaria tabescens]|uniref:Uncharacterized protein n=1 Tax=Armillaria tabescens TaxID=1929756 RepID=A0AA39MZ69_ARMTA|nr:uncharacterized protein EV420DRAFT_1750054 [Desarmillaria tabescens]KAK0452057.1 hypothetical protein EV420DRAFT_1750054 [Desarmillaria tabescens]
MKMMGMNKCKRSAHENQYNQYPKKLPQKTNSRSVLTQRQHSPALALLRSSQEVTTSGHDSVRVSSHRLKLWGAKKGISLSSILVTQGTGGESEYALDGKDSLLTLCFSEENTGGGEGGLVVRKQKESVYSVRAKPRRTANAMATRQAESNSEGWATLLTGGILENSLMVVVAVEVVVGTLDKDGSRCGKCRRQFYGNFRSFLRHVLYFLYTRLQGVLCPLPTIHMCLDIVCKELENQAQHWQNLIGTTAVPSHELVRYQESNLRKQDTRMRGLKNMAEIGK